MSEINSLIAETVSQAGLNKAASAGQFAAKAKVDKVDHAAKEFEAVFISQMLTHMWSGVETDGPFGGGHAENVYRSLLIDEYGKVIAQQGGLGIAEALKAELLNMQSNTQNNSNEEVKNGDEVKASDQQG